VISSVYHAIDEIVKESMNSSNFPESNLYFLREYKIPIFIFFLVLFIGTTFAHPTILLNDEWVTTNQLYQLHAGHQIVVNEGKYGLYENGTLSEYFTQKSNILGYSLFLPLIALPALWITDITGQHFVFLILYLWTFLALAIVLMVHLFFREYSYIGKWRWTPAAIIAVFIVFFINLFNYSPVAVTGFEAFPEILAIVITNIFLLAITSVLIYETNSTLFESRRYSLFGTVVILFSSSYFFWVTGCKDHVLVLPLFSAIFLCLVKYQKTEEYWYLPLAFIISGLLAWARPELALWVFLAVCAVFGRALLKQYSAKKPFRDLLLFLLSPLFTGIGALPFFLNNYLITKNFLHPPYTLYYGASADIALKSTRSLVEGEGMTTSGSLIGMMPVNIAPTPATFLNDLLGIFILPQNGSVGILAVSPFFLVMVAFALILLVLGKLHLSREEKNMTGMAALISLCVFLAYFTGIHGLNASYGITPDIRYLSPMYIPLAVIALIIWKNVDEARADAFLLLKRMMVFCLAGVPLSWIINSGAYSDSALSAQLIVPLNTTFSLVIFFFSILTLGTMVVEILTTRWAEVKYYLVPLLCSIPFIWQINASFYVWQFGTAEGYPYWIPIVQVFSLSMFHA